MGKKTPPKDMFMQFAAIKGETSGATTTTLREFQINTGLSIRGNLVWLVHMLEFWVPKVTGTGEAILAALSTRQGLTVFPRITDDGVIGMVDRRTIFITSGGLTGDNPIKIPFLPPVPLAAPALSLYCKTEVHDANMQDKDCDCRISFTTAPLEPSVYAEIAETWGW